MPPQMVPMSTNAVRQPKSPINQFPIGGTMTWARAVPDRVTPMASPRPRLNTLATAAVHTVDLMVSDTRAKITHIAIHWNIEPLISEKPANTRLYMISPGSASRRVPQRSIRTPKNGERMATITEDMESPAVN
ncbi:MAG: hypothetical protein H6R24_2666 [Proteobacteria bacterium]|nr:hypothetical protein [Pseudomonadota bacterium]